MTAAGPASDDAYKAPNNQPAPMIDPKDAKRSPSKPISRRSLRTARSGVPTNGCPSSAIARPFHCGRPEDLLGHGPDHGPSPRVKQQLEADVSQICTKRPHAQRRSAQQRRLSLTRVSLSEADRGGKARFESRRSRSSLPAREL